MLEMPPVPYPELLDDARDVAHAADRAAHVMHRIDPAAAAVVDDLRARARNLAARIGARP